MDKKVYLRYWPQLCFYALLLAGVGLSLAFLLHGVREARSSMQRESFSTLVIDPGHGGFDGGAISDDGSKESVINLSIAMKLKAMVEFFGEKVVLTRCDDSNRTDFASYSEHEDLVLRTALVNQTPGAVLISIHQNDFPTSQPSGSQVLYAATEGSERFGKQAHQALIDVLDPENRRVAAPVPSSLYITANVHCPAILVECGFMSNNFEVEKLNDSGYQRRIAAALTSSYLCFIAEGDNL